MKLKISLAQIKIQTGKLDQNLCRGLDMIHAAARNGSSMVVLPELWSSGYDLQNKKIYSQQNISVIEQLCIAAQKNCIAIGGSFLQEKDGGFYNTYILINAAGQIQTKYSKIHLFGLMDENKWLESGSQLVVTNFPFGDVGLAICYDLRFPEMFRSYALQGVSMISLCAQWPFVRISHWQTLLRARAIEDQLFITAVNCVGQDGKYNFGGRSAIISPWGETIIEGSDQEEELITGEIDISQVKDVRNSMSILSDRRPDIY